MLIAHTTKYRQHIDICFASSAPLNVEQLCSLSVSILRQGLRLAARDDACEGFNYTRTRQYNQQ